MEVTPMKNICFAILTFLLLITVPVQAEDLNLKIDLESTNLNYMLSGGGSSGETIKYHTEPHQNAGAHSVDTPRVLFNPDNFRNLYTEEGYIDYSLLTQYNSWNEVLTAAAKQGYRVKWIDRYKKIAYNTKNITIHGNFPKRSGKLISFQVIMPSIDAEAFLDAGILFGGSVIKSFTNTNDCVIIISHYIKGKNVYNAFATRAGLSIMGNSQYASGLGIGSNTGTGESQAFTGWVLNFRAYDSFDGNKNKLATPESSVSSNGLQLYSLLVRENKLTPGSDNTIAKNLQLAQGKIPVLENGANIYIDAYTMPGADQHAIINIIRIVQDKMHFAVYPALGTNNQSILSRFIIDTKPFPPEKIPALSKNGVTGVIDVHIK
jgi:hypothetical protein